MIVTRLLARAGLLSCAGLLACATLPASALPVSKLTDGPAIVVPVAEGCGPGAWRGPWGHCRDTPYSGPLPGGGYAAPPAAYGGYYGNGCPPGFWRGPWGHCRDTPYHGRLPNGAWQ